MANINTKKAVCCLPMSDFLSSERKENVRKRLNAIQGQVRGINKMVKVNKPCYDILIQISATCEALKSTGRVVLRNYIERCATDAIKKNNPRIYDEIMDIFAKFSKA